MKLIHDIGALLDKFHLKSSILKLYDSVLDLKSYISYLRLKNSDQLYISTHPVPKILSIDESLDYLLAHKVSVCRYGDGEFNLIEHHSLGFQPFSETLSSQLEHILQSPTDDILICLPGILISPKLYNKKTQNFWGKILVQKRKIWYNWLLPDYQYGNADISRCYISLVDQSKSGSYFQKLQLLWQDKNVLLVEGNQSRLGIGNDLFDGVKSLRRILCPAIDAFSSYDKIIEAILSHIENTDMILLALGPTATVMAYELSQMGHYVLDIGNVDNEYEWFLSGAKQKVRNPLKFSMEVKGGAFTAECTDKDYLNQIIEIVT